jgi:hypothetical protein
LYKLCYLKFKNAHLLIDLKLKSTQLIRLEVAIARVSIVPLTTTTEINSSSLSRWRERVGVRVGSGDGPPHLYLLPLGRGD